MFGALLRRLSEPGTVHVVVMEDVHWADEATLDLLRFLGRRIRSAPALLIVTYRDDELTAGDPLRLALGELATQRSTRRIGLARLSASAVEILARESGIDAVELYRLTNGNPFYVTEVVRAGLVQVPPSARDAVLARVARLGGPARDVLEAAALIGTRIEVGLLAAVTGCSVDTLDALRHSGPADDAVMAFHAEAAGDRPAVVHHARRAAQRAAELASHREAAAQYQRALRAVTDDDPALAAGLYDGLGSQLALIDRWSEAALACESARARWRLAGDQVREAATLRLLSVSMWRLCRGREATEAAEAALAVLEPLAPSAELAWAYANLATLRMQSSEHALAIDLALRAQAIAEPLGALDVLSDALDTQACATMDMGGDWESLMGRALQTAISADRPGQVGLAYVDFYACYCNQRRYLEAEPYFVDGIRYCDEHDMATFGRCLRGSRSVALTRLGRWDAAAAVCMELLQEPGASPINRMAPLRSLGQIRLRRGEPGGWDCLDEALAAAEGTGEAPRVIGVRLARAEAFWLEGRAEEARAEIEAAAGLPGDLNPWQRGELATWLRRTGSARPLPSGLAEPYRRQVEGDWSGAARLLVGLGCPYDAALAHLDSGQEAALRQALDIFVELGATAAVRIARSRSYSSGRSCSAATVA